MSKKPAIKSLGVWGSTTTLISWVYVLIGALSNLPPELFDETKAVWVMILGTVGAVIALVGRWRAALQISGIFKTKE